MLPLPRSLLKLKNDLDALRENDLIRTERGRLFDQRMLEGAQLQWDSSDSRWDVKLRALCKVVGTGRAELLSWCETCAPQFGAWLQSELPPRPRK